MPPRLSLIAPVYNVEEWLEECLLSIQNQTIDDWEAIVVIDGSTDGSEAIARNFADRDPRFSVHVFGNDGPGAGRNRGLALATGEYVMFVDADDYITVDGAAVLIDSLERTGSDYATSIGSDVFPDQQPQTYWAHRGPLFAESRERVSVRSRPDLVLDHTSWAKVFRRAFLLQHGLQHPERTLYEDVQHQVAAALAASSVDVLNVVTYFHRRRAGAISANHHGSEVVVDWVTQVREVRGRLVSFGDGEVLGAYLRRLIPSEAPLRVKVAGSLGDRALQDELRGLLISLLEQAADLGVVYPDTMNMLFVRLFADGTLQSRWSLDGGSTPLVLEMEDWGKRVETDLAAIGALHFRRPPEQRLGRLIFERTIVDGQAAGAWRDPRLVSRLAEASAALPRGVAEQLAKAVEGRFGLYAFVTRVLSGGSSEVIDPQHVFDAPVFSATLKEARASAGGAATEFLLTGEAEVVLPQLEDPRVRGEVVLRPQGAAPRFLPATLLRTSLGEGGDRAGYRWSARLEMKDGERLESAPVFLRLSHPVLGRADELVVIPESLRAVGGAVSEHVSDVVFGSDGMSARAVAVRPWSASDSEAEPTVDQEPATQVLAFPYWNSNPFLNILYLAIRAESGFEVHKVVLLPDILRGLRRLRSGDIAHVHWTRTICQDAETEDEARKNLDRFTTAVQRARDRGAKLVWTVNNVVAHDARYPEVEVELNRVIADMADVVHVMAPETVDAASEYYSIPADRVVHIDHPSYVGVYGRPLERAEALERLGAPDRALNVLFFGRIHPYKGVDQLLGALALPECDRREDIGLFLAGKMNPEHAPQIESMLPDAIPITSNFEFVPDAEVPLWLSAVDLLVLPYRRVLNSGSLHLAATFGVSVLLPDEPHLVRQFEDEEWVHFYDRRRAESDMARFLGEWEPSSEERERARAFARERLPYAISSKVKDMLVRTAQSGSAGTIRGAA
ncbi:glycosyltransferase [Leucobacter sp. wl10]|uniref:glycosyltransferase n=1 Tax=Leucobacter sp. wl10 TaxID=2304677 RepID=UPI0013C36161|nr:glycosyltransferase [Leucobacter sp. wl10]